MEAKRELPIWFFVGAILCLYGFIVLGANIAQPQHELALPDLSRKAGIAWGVVMVVVGAVFLRAFHHTVPGVSPARGESGPKNKQVIERREKNAGPGCGAG